MSDIHSGKVKLGTGTCINSRPALTNWNAGCTTLDQAITGVAIGALCEKINMGYFDRIYFGGCNNALGALL